jgi:DNA-binding transcriptional LysR family regulator
LNRSENQIENLDPHVTTAPPQARQTEPASASTRLRLNLRQLEVFVATAHGGSTRAGAERVARSQSAASTAIADLETALGTQLFDRVGRRLVLNEHGRALLPRAAALLAEAGDLQQLFSGEHAAPLRIAASFTIGEYLLPERVAQWQTAHPGSHLRMRVSNTNDVIAAVARFDADIGFVEGARTHPDLLVRPWLSDELVVFAAPAHPLAGRRVGVDQLRSAAWVVREPGSGTREATDHWLLEHLGAVDIAYELGSTEAIKRLVGFGAGIGCVSRYAVAQAFDEGWLVPLKTKLPKAVRRLATVVHRGRPLGAHAEAFMRHCTG